MFSTVYRIFLILIILIVQAPPALSQERSAYRIEVLVLRHIENTEPAEYSLSPAPANADALDFLQPDAAPVPDPLQPWPPDSTLLPPIGPFPLPDPFEHVLAIGDRSERMSAVWRNLRLSESFRPEAFVAWEQPVDPPFPLVRIHSEEVIAIDDPYIDLRELAVPPFEWNPAAARLQVMQLPDPERHYALEGTVQLRRSRFLHVDLDVSYRTAPAIRALEVPPPPLSIENLGFGSHRLVQSRLVRTGRMEYFDSPVLGALVWITEVEYLDDEEAGEPAP